MVSFHFLIGFFRNLINLVLVTNQNKNIVEYEDKHTCACANAPMNFLDIVMASFSRFSNLTMQDKLNAYEKNKSVVLKIDA